MSPTSRPARRSCSAVTDELLRNAGDLRFAGEREVELKGLGGSHRVFALDWH